MKNLDAGVPQLVAERHRAGVNGRLGGPVSERERERQEGKTGGNIHDGGTLLLLKMRQQSCGEADGAEPVGGDNSLRVGQVWLLGKELLRAHDFCVID